MTISIDHKSYWKTSIAVLMMGLIFFSLAAIFDRVSGGPEARQAAISANSVLSGLDEAQLRAECATTYTNADTASDALLLIAFGRLIVNAAPSGHIDETLIEKLRVATEERLDYLVLRSNINELCDPSQPGGSQPLDQENAPTVTVLED